MAWKFSGGPKYSPEFLYIVAVWGLIQSTYRISRRLFILDASQEFELNRGDLNRLLASREPSDQKSGLYHGWMRVFVKPMPLVKVTPKVLPLGRCVYLLENGRVVHVLARSTGDAVEEAMVELAALGLQAQEDEEERFVVLP